MNNNETLRILERDKQLEYTKMWMKEHLESEELYQKYLRSLTNVGGVDDMLECVFDTDGSIDEKALYCDIEWIKHEFIE